FRSAAVLRLSASSFLLSFRLPPTLTSFPTRRSSDLENIVTAGSVAEALDVFQRELPDMAVLDVMLPDGDGFRLFQKLREKSRIPDRKSTRLNSSHVSSSYAVFCLKKTKQQSGTLRTP